MSNSEPANDNPRSDEIRRAVEAILMVNGYVNAVDGFTQAPAVINGASDLLVEVFCDVGKHARAAVSMSGLPLDTTTEVQITLAFRE